MAADDEEHLLIKVCLPVRKLYLCGFLCMESDTRGTNCLTYSKSVHCINHRYQDFPHLISNETGHNWMFITAHSEVDMFTAYFLYHQPYCVWSRHVCRQQSTSHCRSSWALNPYTESSVLPLPSGTTHTLSAHSVRRPLQGESRKSIWVIWLTSADLETQTIQFHKSAWLSDLEDLPMRPGINP